MVWVRVVCIERVSKIEAKVLDLAKPRNCSENRYSLAGKVVLITGASRGIGKAIALRFASNGARLILLSRNENLLQAVKSEVRALNGNALCEIVVCDVRDRDSLIDKLSVVCQSTDTPDILINNAGFFKSDSANHSDKQIWQDSLAINLTAAYELSSYVSQAMINKGWGRIVNISSISGQQGEAYGLSYSAAKAGLIGLTRSMALQLGKYGITVNAVCPGWVETQMSVDQLQDPQWCQLNNIDPEQSLEIARLSAVQERMLVPDEIAHLSAFLSSEQAKGITGQSINICGGLSLI